MILTKDNLLRFLTEKKYVTPTTVAESFETTTMIASAALSEIVKDKKALITNLKLGSTPYYYDPKQKDCLIELGEKHFSKYEKDVFEKLKTQQVLNDVALSIQERLAIDRIKDFAIPLEINYQGTSLKFWVWYLRDIDETRKQILVALSPSKESKPAEIKENRSISTQSSINSLAQKQLQRKQRFQETLEQTQLQEKNFRSPISEQRQIIEDDDDIGIFRPSQSAQTKTSSQKNKEDSEKKAQIFVEQFLRENYLKILEKDKQEKGIQYKSSVKMNSIEIIFDCYYFQKKPQDADIIKFYSSSQNPKIIFIVNSPKKFFKLAEKLDNLTIVNI